MLKSIRLKNFKSIADSGIIEFAPITIFVGPNNSGKSSIFQFLLALKKTLESRENVPISTRREIDYHDLGDFKDFVYLNDTSKSIDFELVFESPNSSRRKKSSRTYKHQIKSFSSITIGKNGQLYLKQYKLQYDGRIIEINSTEDKKIGSIKGLFDEKELKELDKIINDFIKDREMARYVLPERNKEAKRGDILDAIKRSLTIYKFYFLMRSDFYGFGFPLGPLILIEDFIEVEGHKLSRRKSRLSEKEKLRFEKIKTLKAYLDRIRNFDRYFRIIRSELPNSFNNLFYIGPLRTYPQRYYPISGEIPIDVGFRGEKAIDVIVSYSKKSKEVLKKVNKWIKKFELGSNVRTVETEEFHIAALNILHSKIKKGKRGKLNVNITDMGFGTSQVLPIIIEGFYVPENSMIMIEQPEVHLHPKMQADLADVLIDITKTNKRLIIETHSEHLINRLQRRIAEGEIAAESIKIYYFEMTENGTLVRKVNLDKYGRLEDWPQGFFEEGFNEAYQYSMAIGKKLRGDKDNGE